jgi:hypothetical protein
MTRNGKIARLPREIRAELNRRLQDGEPGTSLVEWLGTLPEVQRVLSEGFGGRPISEQNLSEWKRGGYQEWLAQQETLAHARELSADARELSEAADGLLTDHLAAVLTARYARLLAGWDGEVNEDFRRKLRALRTLSQDIVELRRGDHSAARLRIEQERLDEQKDWTEEEAIEYFQRWADNPRVRESICGPCLSPEERRRRIREIFGLPPEAEPGEGPGASPTESNPIKPNQTE